MKSRWDKNDNATFPSLERIALAGESAIIAREISAPSNVAPKRMRRVLRLSFLPQMEKPKINRERRLAFNVPTVSESPPIRKAMISMKSAKVIIEAFVRVLLLNLNMPARRKVKKTSGKK